MEKTLQQMLQNVPNCKGWRRKKPVVNEVVCIAWCLDRLRLPFCSCRSIFSAELSPSPESIFRHSLKFSTLNAFSNLAILGLILFLKSANSWSTASPVMKPEWTKPPKILADFCRTVMCGSFEKYFLSGLCQKRHQESEKRGLLSKDHLGQSHTFGCSFYLGNILSLHLKKGENKLCDPWSVSSPVRQWREVGENSYLEKLQHGHLGLVRLRVGNPAHHV